MPVSTRRRRAPASVMFAGEARRHARRWYLHGARLGFAALLVGVLISMWMIAVPTGRKPIEELGRFLFEQARDFELLVGALVGTSVAALVAAEERRSGVLELIGLSRLSPRRIFAGQLVASLGVLVLTLLGTTPLLSLLVAEGGVAAALVVNTSLHVVALVIALAAVASPLALHSGRPLTAVLASTSWGMGALMLLPQMYAAPSMAAGMRGRGWVYVVPSGSSWPWDAAADLWAYGVPVDAAAARVSPIAGAFQDHLAPWPLVWTALVVLVAVDRGGEVVAAIGDGRGIRRGAGWWLRLVTQAAVACAALVVWLGWPDVGVDLPLVCAVALLLAGTGLMLDLSLALIEITGRPRARRRWRGMWRMPVAFRELRTRAHANAGMVGWWLGGLWCVAVFEGWWLVPGSMRLLHVDPVTSLLAVGVLMTALSATASIHDELASGTLPSLLATTTTRTRIVVGKLVAVLARGLPFLVVGAALVDVRLIPWIVAFGTAVATCAMAVAASLRSARVAWSVNAVLVLGFAIAMAQMALWPVGAWVRRVLALPVVVLEHGGASTLEMLVSALPFVALSVVAAAFTAWRLGPLARS